MNVIDLTVQLSKSTPVYPGDPSLVITEIGTVKKRRISRTLVSPADTYRYTYRCAGSHDQGREVHF